MALWLYTAVTPHPHWHNLLNAESVTASDPASHEALLWSSLVWESWWVAARDHMWCWCWCVYFYQNLHQAFRSPYSVVSPIDWFTTIRTVKYCIYPYICYLLQQSADGMFSLAARKKKLCVHSPAASPTAAKPLLANSVWGSAAVLWNMVAEMYELCRHGYKHIHQLLSRINWIIDPCQAITLPMATDK